MTDSNINLINELLGVLDQYSIKSVKNNIFNINIINLINELLGVLDQYSIKSVKNNIFNINITFFWIS